MPEEHVRPPEGFPPSSPPPVFPPGPPALPSREQIAPGPAPGLQPAYTGPNVQRPASPERAKSPTHQEHKDGTREIVETIVFVVVLVLLLKTFLAEAFVIPTGSMATTLLGYHFDVTCEQCGYAFKVNASSEADPQERTPQRVVGSTCPNCRHHNDMRGRQAAPEGGGP
jgi:hypothetical protein